MTKNANFLELPEGSDVSEFIPLLLESVKEVSTVRLHALDVGAKSGERVVDLPEMRPIVEEALTLRHAYQVPFWEAILLLARREGGKILDAVLDSAVRHQSMAEYAKEITVPATMVSPSRLREYVSELDANQVLAFSSRIQLRPGEYAHYPMLDFRIRPSEHNEELAAKVVTQIGLSGTLLNSGNSYHFYGDKPMHGERGLFEFLGRASLFVPFVDQRWIAHQMIEGACALRVSRGKSFSHAPQIVRRVEV